MDSEFLQGFLAQAEGCLPIIRRGIVASARTGNAFGELNNSLRQTASIKDAASIVRLDEATQAAEKLEEKLKVFAALKTPLTGEQSEKLLDSLGELETTLAQVKLNTENFSSESFDAADEDDWTEEFEPDAETLKIFAEEAEELVAKIAVNLENLAKQPDDQESLLEIRRSAHTLKGSAGIVGLKMLADVAHRAEDLLDYLGASGTAVGRNFFEILCGAADCFGALANGENSPQLAKKINRLYEHFDALAATLPIRKSLEPSAIEFPERPTESFASAVASDNSAHRPIVRVSLAKLTDLEKMMSEAVEGAPPTRLTGDSASLFENQQRLITEMLDKLRRLRMIAFDSLAVRLRRAVRVTAEETEKSAELNIANGDLEIDSQQLDALIEPLTHLLRNAVAHGIEPPENRRTLGKPKTGRIEISVFQENSGLTLIVSDDGRGISAADLKAKAVQTGIIGETEAAVLSESETFELIFFAGLSTVEKVNRISGRGVGMDIVKTVVTQQRGTISVDSAMNRGTTFTIRLPMQTRHTPFVKPKKRRRDGKLSVLVVDDSANVRQHLSKVIENAGWQAIAAQDGLDALDILQGLQRLPDVILSDLEMPRINGGELLTILKERENLREIPVVMITSSVGSEQRQQAFDLGAAEYLSKPFDNKHLIETIKTLTA